MTFRSILRAAVAVVVAAGVGIAAPTAARATASDPEATTVWKPAPDGGDRSLPVPVAASETFTLDIDAMTRALVPAVSRRTTGVDGGAEAVISVPTPTGELVRFAVTPVEVLADRLQQANPQIRTFAGRGVDDVGLTIRADITPLGFHAMIRSADGRTKAWFVDPATVGDDSRHVSYAAGASDLPRLQELERGTVEEGPESPPTADVGDGETTVALRTVRLALANDPAFASFYGTDNVLAAKVSIVNRVAGVFNDDLGVRLVLSEGTDRLNFDTDAAATQPGGACGPDACFTPEALRGCEVETLRQNSAAVAGIVGNDAYDVGHIVLGGGGGGIAGYGEVGLDFVKGGGCTGSATPVGDAFAIDYVAHEIGHQLGASHTFNACGGSSGATAVEPGSGSTIMAYAGLCGANDLQTHSDPYLSHASIDEIHRTLDQRLPALDTANTAPTVTPPASRTIPIRTPFALTAEATDAEGPVFLLWEQADVGDGDRALLDDTKTAGPLFRVFGVRADISEADARTYFSPGRNLASTDATRTFPDLTQILRGNTNADTGVCGATLTPAERVDCASEFLPTAAYGGTGPASLNFRVTARDADPRGGGVTGAQVRLDVDRTAGPLLVSGLEDTDGRYVVNSRHTLRWVVNGTGREGLAPRVRVVMSTDGGERFDRVLLEDTPNDGSAAITLPETPAADVRFRVEAIDNYFFAIGPDPIEIVASSTPEPTPEPTREPDPTATPGATPGPVPSPPAPDGGGSAPSAGPRSPGAPPVVDAAGHRDSASLARTGGPDGVLAALMGAGAVLLGVAVRGGVRRTRRTVSPISKEGKAT